MSTPTDKRVRSLAACNARRITVGRSLYLELRARGRYAWRWDYRYKGRRHTLTMGFWPEVSVAEAEAKRRDARAHIDQGIDPSERQRAIFQTQRAARSDSVEAVAREWCDMKSATWSERTRRQTEQMLVANVYGQIGVNVLSQVTHADIRERVLLPMRARGVHAYARRVLRCLSQIWRYARATQRTTADPCGDLGYSLSAAAPGHFSAQIEPEGLAMVLRAIETRTAQTWQTRPPAAALRILPYVFTRPAELCGAQWADVDLQGRQWRYTVGKTGRNHIVPLASQVLLHLEVLRADDPEGSAVFPGLTTDRLRLELRASGVSTNQQSLHGFRATARTMLDELLGVDPALIEHSLGHVVRDPLGRSYNRTKHLPQRVELMQRWADHLDRLRSG